MTDNKVAVVDIIKAVKTYDTFLLCRHIYDLMKIHNGKSTTVVNHILSYIPMSAQEEYSEFIDKCIQLYDTPVVRALNE